MVLINKVKITLKNPKEIANFINICSKYDCDVDLYDGSVVVDAKSIVSVFSVQLGKIVEVKAITSDESVISKFVEDMRKFEV